MGELEIFDRDNVWEGGNAKEITFIVTKDCQLACKYCYLVGKNTKEKMSWDIAKKTIDYVLDNEFDENFNKKFLINHPDYRNERLIKNEKASLNFEDITKVHDTLGYLNIYIQKQFISYLNKAERNDPLVGIVTE